MKIWILTSETPVYNPGGIARYVDNIARYLARRGHSVRVFGRDDEDRSVQCMPGYAYESVVPRWDCGTALGAADASPNWPYNILDYWGAFSWQMAAQVREAIAREGAPDVIESQEYCALPYYLLQAKYTGGWEGQLESIPILVNAHSPDFLIRKYNQAPQYTLPHYWTGHLERACLLMADAVICPSAYLSRQLEALLDGRVAVRHLPLPWTEPDRYGAVTADAQAAGDILYYGRLEVRKGVVALVNECERLWADGLEFRLRLIGGDTEYFPRGMSVGEWLRKRHAASVAAGRLVIEAALPHRELMGRIAAARFVVIPSLWENWPNTCIEAMMLGKVVLGSVHGGQAEMLGDDGRCGRCFSWEQPESFSAAFRALMQLSAAQRAQMGTAAQARIAQWCDADTVVEQRIAHFEALVSARGRYAERRAYPFVNPVGAAPEIQVMETETAGRVSVVIPYYNLGALVEEAIASVKAANYADTEIVLVDDGSTEADSLAVIERLERAGQAGLRIVRQRNAGLAAARNAGVAAATGRYILLLDADDAIEPGFIRRSLEVLARWDNVHVVCCWERYFGASADIYPCWNLEFPYLLGHNMTCPITLLYRQSYLKAGGSRPVMAYNFEDYELWIRMVGLGYGIVALPEILCRYRIRENSMWQGSGRAQHLYLMEQIAALHPQLYARWGAELYGLLNANGSSQKWIKPCAYSPYDEYARWSAEQITWLEGERRRWWEAHTAISEKLATSEAGRHALWEEKNALLEQIAQMATGRKTEQ